MVCFQTKIPNIGKFWRALQFEDVGIFYGHLVNFTAFWYILWTFGIFCGNLVYFSRFGIFFHEKSGNLAWFDSVRGEFRKYNYNYQKRN
jgi:hypothetical protein